MSELLWRAFVTALLGLVIKVVGPIIQRALTQRFLRKAQEINALADSKLAEPLEQQIARLQVELGLACRARDSARADLDAVGEDLRALANRNSLLEAERDEWKARAEASAKEAEDLRKSGLGGKHVATSARGSGSADRAARPFGSGGAGTGRTDHVPTVPPSGRGGRPPK